MGQPKMREAAERGLRLLRGRVDNTRGNNIDIENYRRPKIFNTIVSRD